MTHEAEADLAEPDFDLGPSGCLDFLWPALPEALVGKAERDWIEETALKLPPIPRLALELPLGKDEHGADLHQQIRGSGADVEILKRYLSRPAAGPLEEPGLIGFLNDWARDTDLRDDLDCLYLEWDRPPAGAAPAAPGFFLPVERPGVSRAEGLRRRSAARRHAERIQPGRGDCVREALETLSPRLPLGVAVSYVGFMLGRAGALRVNLRGIRRSDLAPLLEVTGWPGDRAIAARHFERLVGISDRVVVALDFTPALQPRIGFEVVLDLPPKLDPRWRELFDHLVAEGVCGDDKRRALEALDGRFYPEAKDQPWPASWLVAAVLSPQPFVPWVERRVSHLKLSVAADGSAAAKAYVSAQHHWSRGDRRPPAGRASTQGPPADILASASDKAIGFLAGAIGQDDLWRDFSMPGASDEWVTAFVGHVLTAVDDERARSTVARSLEALLRRQRPEGGWGYNGLCPADADSTAWALKFLTAARCAGAASERAKTFLLSHRLPEGGLSTYSQSVPVRFEDRPWDGPSQGWRSSHACVVANAAGALPGELTDSLLADQRPDGSWRAYWWRTDAFSTALAVEAFAGDGNGEDATRRAIGWARGQARAASSAFDRAWLARILIHGDGSDRDSARDMLATLAQEQSDDGAWAAGAQLLLPHPSQLRPDEGLIPFLDLRRVFTTASVLAAIAALASESL